MTQKLCYVIFNTSAGWVGILGSRAGLLRVTLPQRLPEGILQQLGISPNQAALTPQRFQNLMERLRAYFDGHKVDFPDCLDFSTNTAFQREVWETTRLIPYGETRSYTWVAEQIKKPKAMRAVGQALGKNPLPIVIPCHRVLPRAGGVGNYLWGAAQKEKLLIAEKAPLCA